MHIRLGPYLVDEQIGRGGMGIVYLAHHETTDEQVAIKVLPAGFGSEDSFRVRFEAEIDALTQLNHPNIVQIIGFGEQDGELFYVMEYIEGQSLHQVVKENGPLHWQDVVRIAISICKALKHAHDRGIIHRDIKPANLLLTVDGDAKLLDFGIAKLYGSNNLTADHAIVGTADYMAPEQAEGARPSIKSDIFSLSSAMYAVLCGRPPFSAANVPAIMHKLRFEEPVRIGKRVEDLPVDIDYLIHAGLTKNPDKRIPTATVMMHQLQAIQDGYEELMSRQTPGLDLLTADSSTDVLAESAHDSSEPNELQTVAGEYDHAFEATDETMDTAVKTEAESRQDEAKRTHYTKVDSDSLSSEDLESGGKLGAVLSILLLLLMVGGLSIGVWNQMKPLDANQLLTEIESASNQNEKLRLMEQFFERFPEHAQTITIRPAYESLKRKDGVQRLRKRVLKSSITNGLSAHELRIREIWNSNDPVSTRIGLLEAFLLIGESGSLIPDLVKELIDELSAEEDKRREQIRSELAAQIKQLAIMMNDDPEQARKIISGLIKAYGDLPWLTEEIQKLNELAAM